MKPHTIIDSPADWTSASLKGKEATFTYRFTEADTAELIKAVDVLKQRGVATEDDIKAVCLLVCLLPVCFPEPECA